MDKSMDKRLHMTAITAKVAFSHTNAIVSNISAAHWKILIVTPLKS